MRRSRLLLLMVVPLLMAGCTIIDRRTFRSSPKPGPVVAGAPAPPPPREGPPALVIIQPSPGIDLRAALQGPVAAALARKPTVAFEVAAVVPPGSPLPATPPPPPPGPARKPAPVPPTPLDTLSGPAQSVAKIIASFGVPETRIRLSARTDAGAPSPELRVYVQ